VEKNEKRREIFFHYNVYVWLFNAIIKLWWEQTMNDMDIVLLI